LLISLTYKALREIIHALSACYILYSKLLIGSIFYNPSAML
jgi:hypothetical protein